MIPPGINPLPALWRSYKYEDVYLRDYGNGDQLHQGAQSWFSHYNYQRPHQALDYATPSELYFAPESHGARPADWVKRVGLQEYVL